MNQLQTQLPTDTWVTVTWNEYLRAIEDPNYAKAKGYYYNGQMRIEAMGVGPDHASDNGIIYLAITLFCMLNKIPIQGLINCSYRKTGVRECQPDISYYVGERVKLAPQGSSIANLDAIAPPDIAIEIADSSLNDDLGQKRLLYEDMEIPEYWVVDVENTRIVAFQIVKNGSTRITESQVLPGLAISVLREALEMSRTMDQAQVGIWLMGQFQQK